MFNMSTALSALRANQMALSVIGNNVANASTPDYHRQDLRLVDMQPIELGGIHIGQGVDISYVDRAFDAVTESSLTRNISEQASIETRLQVSRQVESLMTPGQGTILDRLETLFEDLERLTAQPDNTANRSIVVRSAQNLTEQINEVARQLNDLVARLDREIEDKLVAIRESTQEIVDLNIKIRAAEVRELSPNDLKDRRDQLVNELAKVIDVRVDMQVTDLDDSDVPEAVLRMADGQVQLSRSPLELQAYTDPQTGHRLVFKSGSAHATEVTQGELGGLLTARNELVPEYQERIAEFTRGLITAFDNVHINGLGIDGSFDTLRGERYIDRADIPLSEAETVVPIQSGSMFISVIDPAGVRTVHEIVVDPSVDSLLDVASRISDIDHLEARVDSPPGQLSIRAELDYQFDFVTVQPTLLNATSITGTTVPQVAGEYHGTTNDEYTFEFLQSGTIGVTPGMTLAVRDSVGSLVGEFNVGEGYEAGSPLVVGAGIKVSLSVGDANINDQFALKLVSQSDSTNLLLATGINTLFSGTSPFSLAVRADLIRNPEQFAMTRSGDPLDARNAEAMLAVRYSQFMDNGTETLEENLTDIIGSIGGEVRDLDDSLESLGVIGQSLRAARDSVSGVDPNEEAVKMLQFQRGFQSAARYIVVMDETLEELMGIIR